VSAQVALASRSEVDYAVVEATRAFPAWRDTSLARRTRVLFAFRELLNQRQDELAEIITAEHGKVEADARGEVARGHEVVEFAYGIAHLRKGSLI
jgi:malonate-semialdehyde dehydrogenase (acetylating)/methylmalonate-semialdehyde dehydrogenase